MIGKYLIVPLLRHPLSITSENLVILNKAIFHKLLALLDVLASFCLVQAFGASVVHSTNYVLQFRV
jgi:hypothetical protein